jgi:hypothetical protein
MNFDSVFNICFFFYIDKNSTFEIICLYVTLEIDLVLPVNFHVIVFCVVFSPCYIALKCFITIVSGSQKLVGSSIDMNFISFHFISLFFLSCQATDIGNVIHM